MSKGTCKHEGCNGAAVGKGYCSRHYRKWKRGGLPKPRYKICTHEGCRKPRKAGSRCEEHAGKAAGSEQAAPAPAAAN